MTAGAGGPAGTALPGHNADVAALFDESADLRELEEANPFRVRADCNAARVVRDLSRDVTGLGAAGEDHTELPGVGEELLFKGRRALGNASFRQEASRRLFLESAYRWCVGPAAATLPGGASGRAGTARAPPRRRLRRRLVPIYRQAAARREEPGPPSQRAAWGIDPGKSSEAALSRALDALREFGLTNSVAAGEEAAHE